MTDLWTDLISELSTCYPLSKTLAVGELGRQNEALPWYPWVLQSIVQRRARGASCILLPTRSHFPFALTLITALSKIREGFDELELDQQTAPLKREQRVRVAPDGWVFEFLEDGKEIGGRRYIALRAFRDQLIHHIPDDERFRLTPTDSRTPESPIGRRPGKWSRLAIDEILNTRTGGNLASIPNQVVLVSPRAKNIGLRENISLGTYEQSHRTAASEVLTWGHLMRDGTVISEDRRDGTEEPIIAVTHTVDYISALCRVAERGTRVVIMDGVSYAIRNLQGFDDIAERQRLVVIASHDELRHVTVLRDRGCEVWAPSPTDILMSEISNEGSGRGWFEHPMQQIQNSAELKITGLLVEDAVLATMHSNLEQAADSSADTGDDDYLGRLVQRGYGILMELAEWIGEPSPTALDQLEERLDDFQRILEGSRIWIRSETQGFFQNFLDTGEKIRLQELSLGPEKAKVLLQALDGRSESDIAVVARSAPGTVKLQSYLKLKGLEDIPVHQISAVQSGNYRSILLGSWPGKRRMSILLNRYLTPEIQVIGYQFELDWKDGFSERGWTHEWQKFSQTPEHIREIIGLSSWPEAAPVVVEESRTEVHSSRRDPISRILAGRRKGGGNPLAEEEEFREAYYVGFHGSDYVYLTENHKVPVLTDLVLTGEVEGQRIPLHPFRKLDIGDFLLFRDQGSRPVIAYLAEADMGIQDYTKYRNLANLWRAPLVSIHPDSDAVYSKLTRAGLTLSRLTVKHWIQDHDMIGPGSRKDLEIIAQVSGDAELTNRLDDVRDAMSLIRGAHTRAGRRLSELLLRKLAEKLPDLDESGLRVDLGFGGGKIVCIDEVGDEPESRPVGEVNHLMEDPGILI